jgi:(4S)-4-hydroxy-5-phosphonooxypentane-2,3-dione isomerase
VDAYPGKRQELAKFLIWDHKESMEPEPGTIRFDVFQDPENPDRFFVYEAYRDEAAFKEHQEHGPFQRWNSNEFQTSIVRSHSDLNRLEY